jgi:hypothetical protein
MWGERKWEERVNRRRGREKERKGEGEEGRTRERENERKGEGEGVGGRLTLRLEHWNLRLRRESSREPETANLLRSLLFLVYWRENFGSYLQTQNSSRPQSVVPTSFQRKLKIEKRKTKKENEKRKTNNEKRKTKNEKRKTKNEKRKTKNEKREFFKIKKIKNKSI